MTDTLEGWAKTVLKKGQADSILPNSENGADGNERRLILSADSLDRILGGREDLNSILKNHCAKARKDSVLLYDPFGYETLLPQVSAIVDACLGHRREYTELLASAVRSELEFQLFKAQRYILEQMEKNPAIGALKSTEAKYYASASMQFGDGPQSNLSAGFREVSQAQSKLADEAAIHEHARQALVADRWRLLSAHHAELHGRFGKAGHPLNFEERIENVLTLLLDDFDDVLAKCAAVSKGFSAALGIDLDNSYLDSDRPLDTLVHWVRGAIGAFERLRDRDWPAEGILPLNASAQSKSSEGHKVITFNSPTSELGASMFKLRIKAIAFSFSLKDYTKVPDPRLLTIEALLTPNISPSGDESGGRMNHRFPRVGLRHPSVELQFKSGRSFYNLPMQGRGWKLEISGAYYPFNGPEASLESNVDIDLIDTVFMHYAYVRNI